MVLADVSENMEATSNMGPCISGWSHVKRAWVFLGFEHSVNTTHVQRSILPALRSVQRGPEDRAVQQDPGKKADTLHQMWMIKNRTFIELPSGPADLELTEKSCIFLSVEPKTVHILVGKPLSCLLT